ncbi:MAG TPA: iron ABC transporter permease [Tenuifilaceae bacterium]|jgi:iron complex transport system permease protein|nr:iron ABC transporter permease [Tenuifilaceae bacterium]HPH00674.1 iron ABC transporter permease [Tenuifilaceae bacterium]HPS05233.1 iron ABC transporter permease [Tenuifilaceae bacterium]HPW26615.1 iron ABC transporter permease [Tenuifilaceae bacterium]
MERSSKNYGKSKERKPTGKVGMMAVLLAVLVFLLVFIDLLLGSVRIPMSDVLKFIFTGSAGSEVSQNILFNFRLPRVLAAVLSGSALAVSGLLMQTIFRNPLADPSVLGISAGASLGVALVVMGSSALGLSFLGNQFSMVLAALAGSMLVLMLVMAVSVRVRNVIVILILGMMFGFAASAVTSILQYFSSEVSLKSFVIWTMGSLSSISGNQLWIFALLVFLGLVLAMLVARPLNVLGVGENYAQLLGYNVKAIRMVVFISTSLLAGSTTAFVGPVVFVGIAVPHVVRMAVKTSNHHVLLPTTLLAGAAFMLLIDTIAQLPGAGIVLPVNTVAALMGIPVVIYVIFKGSHFHAAS